MRLSSPWLGLLHYTPWQVGRPGWKLGGLDRHLLTRISWHFVFLTTDGKRAVNIAVASSQPITDLYSWIWIWRIMYSSPTYFVVVYCARRRVLSCFVHSAFNVYKVRECHCYIIYIKILFSNNSFIPLAGAAGANLGLGRLGSCLGR